MRRVDSHLYLRDDELFFRLRLQVHHLDGYGLVAVFSDGAYYRSRRPANNKTER